MKRGAISLTISSVVIILFAIAMLWFGLAFIRGTFGEAAEKVTFPVPDIKATADEPIILPFETLNVKKGGQAEFSLNFYNNENETIQSSVKPVITECVPAGLGNTSAATESLGQMVDVGSTATYKALFTIPDTAPSQKYACNINIGKADKQFFVQVQ
ncbi:hypothetical protein JXB11_00360 [Candidatus Woesearchaeota archaeon]|nr:hypothetical protein [Candidatus Woesearchaeota archaeon]